VGRPLRAPFDELRVTPLFFCTKKRDVMELAEPCGQASARALRRG
jgi:hypothetical protein